jgi:hypothetical protein
MGEHQARLAGTLRRLHEVAGKPTLAEIVSYVQKKAGPISDITIGDWKTPGKSAPLRTSTAQFMAVVDFLEARQGQGPRPQAGSGRRLAGPAEERAAGKRRSAGEGTPPGETACAAG